MQGPQGQKPSVINPPRVGDILTIATIQRPYISEYQQKLLADAAAASAKIKMALQIAKDAWKSRAGERRKASRKRSAKKAALAKKKASAKRSAKKKASAKKRSAKKVAKRSAKKSVKKHTKKKASRR